MTESDVPAVEPLDLSPAEIQALHRRLLAAKDRGEQPSAEDAAARERVMAHPHAMFDRPWASDER